MKKFKGLLYKDLLQSKSAFVITVFISILFGLFPIVIEKMMILLYNKLYSKG